MTEGTRTWRPRPFARAMAWVYVLVFLVAVVAGRSWWRWMGSRGFSP